MITTFPARFEKFALQSKGLLLGFNVDYTFRS